MQKHILLNGNVLWAFDHELEKNSHASRFAGLFSFQRPLHHHQGEIILSNSQLVITGDEHVIISLNSIDQLFLGFDDLYPVSSVKNWGAFWQPLRIEYSNPQTQTIYLVIGFNSISAQNKLWYDALKELLSQR